MTRFPEEQAQPKGRARLIDAAIRLFGRDGYDATSVRAVADDAAVSWGLVRFYFGSKEGLREAAEQHVSTAYLDLVSAASGISSGEELFEVIDLMAEDFLHVARFLRRAVIEERPIAIRFLQRLLDTGTDIAQQIYEGFPREDWLADPIRDVATRVGYLILSPQFLSLLGRDVFSVDELKLRNRQNLRVLELIRMGLEAEAALKSPQETG
jgi:AcrR family transcriptional regulator